MNNYKQLKIHLNLSAHKGDVAIMISPNRGIIIIIHERRSFTGSAMI